MKRFSLILAISAASAPAVAEHGVPAEYGYVGIHATQHFFDIGGHVANPDFEDAELFGLQAGWRLSETFSVQLWGETGDLDFEQGSGSAGLDQLFATARWHYREHELIGFEPYSGFTLGHKFIDLGGDNNNEATMVGFEMGLQRAITPRLILDLGTRPTYSTDDERWDGNVYAGLNLVFGAADVKDAADNARDQARDQAEEKVEEAQQAVASAAAGVLDSDGDGVADSADKCPDTTAGAKVDETGCHVLLEHSVNETLNVQFETGGSRVKEESIADIERIAKVMVEYPETSLTIEGHTDSQGSAEFNRRLSQQRADAVKAVLVDRFDIDAARIEAIGKGEDEPVADNGTAEGRAKNRRVETEISASRTEAQYHSE